MPRSGTTSLMKLLNSHESIVSFGESLFWGRQFVKPTNGEFYSRDEIDSLYDFYISYNWINEFNPDQKTIYKQELTAGCKKLVKESEITPKIFFDLLCKVFQSTFKKDFAIEKTPHHIHYTDRIKSYYPNAKFIITYRNPYDFILSYKFQGSQGHIKTREKFERTYHPLQVALIWRKYINSIHEHKNSNSVLALDITTLKGNGIKDLASFLGVNHKEFDVYKKDNSSFSKMKKIPKLKNDDYFWANLILKKYLKENSLYRNSNYDFLGICKSVLKIPLALYYNLFYLELAEGQTKLGYLFNYLKISKNND